MAPSDANGVYTLPDGYLATTGDTILASQHNPPLEDLSESMSQRIMASGAKPFSGPAKLADGTVSVPSLTFATATSTGVYKTTDGIGFSIGGVMVAEMTSGGIRTGARYIGELIPYTGATAQALTVLPYGQLLNRIQYAALWVFAQASIAAGHQFYNNGNGTTTFGIGDLRGRAMAGNDSMGGVAAGRLTSPYFGAGGALIGAPGGTESHPLTIAELAVHNHGVTDPGHVHGIANSAFGGSPAGFQDLTRLSVGPNGGSPQANQNTANVVTGISINNTGSGSAHNNMQPTMIVNYLLFAGA